MRVNRIIIYPKDIQRITGKSERYGRILIKRIKQHYQKDDHQVVSIEEFCNYTGLKLELVKEFLID
jgi:predicted site-specific integrase-resolvase